MIDFSAPVRLLACREITTAEAQILAAVGIVSAAQPREIGYQFKMGGQKFIITGVTDAQEFMTASRGIIPEESALRLVLDENSRYFYRVSTD